MVIPLACVRSSSEWPDRAGSFGREAGGHRHAHGRLVTHHVDALAMAVGKIAFPVGSQAYDLARMQMKAGACDSSS